MEISIPGARMGECLKFKDVGRNYTVSIDVKGKETVHVTVSKDEIKRLAKAS